MPYYDPKLLNPEQRKILDAYPVMDVSQREAIDHSKPIEGPRAYSVTIIMTRGQEINVENGLILAVSPEEAKGLGLLKLVGKGWLAQKIDAAHVPRAMLQDILAKVVA